MKSRHPAEAGRMGDHEPSGRRWAAGAWGRVPLQSFLGWMQGPLSQRPETVHRKFKVKKKTKESRR